MFGSRKNGKIEILLGVGIVVVAMATLAQIAPVFGLIDATTVLFVGVFNYVAYRDVFERRSGNAPLQVAVGRMRPTFSDRQEGLAPKAPYNSLAPQGAIKKAGIAPGPWIDLDHIE
jgi:hypothetical protein